MLLKKFITAIKVLQNKLFHLVYQSLTEVFILSVTFFHFFVFDNQTIDAIAVPIISPVITLSTFLA
ncbi:MAG: hypothetical protein LBQ24_07050 [Candidatus Peribacteria bacterium]|nr:hypothetical protein [Candidatus Peribacteria bacterium]